MRLLTVLLACLTLGACALTEDVIDVPYEGAANIVVVPGAENAAFLLSSSDNRSVYRDRVSVKKNGYGVEMAAIVAANDIPTTVGKAVEQELSSLGFATGPGGAQVAVEVLRFYNDFKSGFLSGDAVAEVAFNVVVHAPDGQLIFTRHYQAGGIEEQIQLASGENARLALIKAFRNAVAQVVQDSDLHRAILSAQPAPPRPPGTPVS